MQERAKTDIQSAQERNATAAQEAAKTFKKAAEELKKANVAQEEAERKLKENIQPLVTPTPEELCTAKLLAQYREGLLHVAVAGVAGGGKSSLINAFRGLHNEDIGSAATGLTVTTMAITRYPNPNVEYPLIWYDIPGAGTLEIPSWQYFNAQGLYVFDCIIVLFDNRFTMTDIAILTNCRRFKIPTYVVRSKADQHIRNIMNDMGCDSNDDESEDQKKLYQAARQQFIQQTRQSVKDTLENANMPDQRVYIVSNETMIDVVKRKQAVKVIDEIELLNELIQETQTRRLRAAQKAAEEAKRAQAAREEAERQLRDGTRPVVTPTPEEYSTFRASMQHTAGFFHVAISGIAGSGKSSLVNALRGKHNMDLDAAAVGVNETTLVVARYPDPNPSSRFVWYDVPGAGTLKIPDWKYFNDQGLFVFDCIIVVVNNRFTATDVAILSNARRFGIPAFIIRSKADQHIRNLMKDIGYDSDDEDGNKASYFARARDQYVAETIRSIKTNLQEANLPDQPVYLVSNVALQATVTGKSPKKILDEVKLLTDLASTAQKHV
ncbi:interferon-inducible GTPase-domain-containing protein [Suillus bovinus]|uniref:interferon-inducible GTPase-domain-containing protein n=1 Tax=Suillus bovinus TaxID=48563 RepID=UPI001B867276|nr:interferon-inducible GTPase-domain-containing protein [Suillus bovinus]KAG2135729.1 interferon-inducible GTPase-domain-containing protein [Suillus bovinus]